MQQALPSQAKKACERPPHAQWARPAGHKRLSPLTPRNRSLGLVVGLPLAFRGPLIPLLLAFGQRQFALHPSLAKIKPSRNQGISLLLGHALELPHLALVQQQLPRTQ